MSDETWNLQSTKLSDRALSARQGTAPNKNRSPGAPRAVVSDFAADVPVLAEEIELLSAWLGEVLADIATARAGTSGTENQ